MKISNSTLQYICKNVKNCNYETGGILGSRKNKVITEVFLDKNNEQTRRCSYTPNIVLFNNQIEIWQKQGINFQGLFHTHFANVETLSSSDEVYIKMIMTSMPEMINTLYFPLFVLPEQLLIPYNAIRKNGEVNIIREALEII